MSGDWSNPELKLDFPCAFPIKVIGASCDEFEPKVCEIAQRHDPDFSTDALRRNQSSQGKYQSVTLAIRATSREQLDAIYKDLKACEWVVWAL